jgi:hypothetical protein
VRALLLFRLENTRKREREREKIQDNPLFLMSRFVIFVSPK